MTLTQAAMYMQVSRQAVYVALISGKMAGTKKDGKWFISRSEVDEYLVRKYNRAYSTIDGKPRFDKKKGELSTREVAEHLNIPMQKAYYLIRSGVLKSFRKQSSYVVLVRDLQEAKKILNNNLGSGIQVGSYDDRTDSNGEPGSVGSS